MDFDRRDDHATTASEAAAAAAAVTSTADLFRREGFFVLPGVLSASEVMQMQQTVYGYLRANGSLVTRQTIGGTSGDRGGWYIADFPSSPALRPIAAQLLGKRKLREAVADVLGGAHRLLSRNEIYIDYASPWHHEYAASSLNTSSNLRG